MRLRCGIMDGQMWDAVLEPTTGEAAGAIVVLSNAEALLPADADFGEFTVVDATDGEREMLRRAGYSMPDWTPGDAPGCGGCHADEADELTRADDQAEPER